MSEVAAMKAAIGLYHLPASVRLVRAEPLPQGIEPLLRIAAGDEAQQAAFAALLDRPASLVRQAAEFFVEQVLLAPDSDHYRILGASANASTAELRHNMALLMSWLHPDKHPGRERSVFAGRVTKAWDTLRSPERRAAYDAHRQAALLARAGCRPDRHRGSHAQQSGVRIPGRHAHGGGPTERRLPLPERDGLLQRGLEFLRRVIRDRSMT